MVSTPSAAIKLPTVPQDGCVSHPLTPLTPEKSESFPNTFRDLTNLRKTPFFFKEYVPDLGGICTNLLQHMFFFFVMFFWGGMFGIPDHPWKIYLHIFWEGSRIPTPSFWTQKWRFGRWRFGNPRKKEIQRLWVFLDILECMTWYWPKGKYQKVMCSQSTWT